MKQLLIAMVCWLAVACGSNPAATGDAEISVTTTALSTVAGVTVTVSGPGMADLQTHLVLVGGTWQATLGGIPAGPDRVFSGSAVDASGVEIFNGQSAPTEIVAGQTAVVILALQSTMPPPAFGNHAPHITSLIASVAHVAPSGTVGLTASATDADGDPLNYAWTGDGSFAPASAAATVWTAPAAAGDYPLTIEVSDPFGAFDAVTLTMHVVAAAQTGSAAITVTFNSYPQIVNLTLAPGHAVAGGTAVATPSAVDADGDALSFAFSDDCGGTWTGAMVSWPATVSASTCTIHVVVDDGRGGQNFGDLTVGVGDIAPTIAPTIDSTFASTTVIDGGGQLLLRLYAHGANGDPVQFSYQVPTGSTVVSFVSEPAYGELIVNAPSCFSGPLAFVITAQDAVTNAGISQTFTIQPGTAPCGCTTLLSTPDGLGSLAASGGYVTYLRSTSTTSYWENFNTGVVNDIWTSGDGYPTTAIAAGGQLYYGDADLYYSGRGGVFTSTLDGSDFHRIGDAGYASDFVAVGSDLYFIAITNSWSVARVSSGGGAVETLLNYYPISGLAYSQGTLYWSDVTANKLVSMPASGGAATVVTSATNVYRLVGLDDSIVFADGNNDVRQYHPATGVNEVMFHLGAQVNTLQLSSGVLYLTTTDGAVWRAAVGSHTPVMLASVGQALDLAIDGTNAYVTAYASGQYRLLQCGL